MAGATSPDNIPYMTTLDGVIDAAYTDSLAEAVQDALDGVRTTRAIQEFRWANAAARAAQTGMSTGDLGLQEDTGVTYRYSGSAWKAWSSDWITFTPVYTGVNFGSTGTAAGQMMWRNGLLRCRYSFVFGGTGISVADFDITLPVNMHSTLQPYEILGTATMVATNIYPLMPAKLTTGFDKMRIYAQRSDAADVYHRSLATGVPATAVAGTTITANVEYRTA